MLDVLPCVVDGCCEHASLEDWPLPEPPAWLVEDVAAQAERWLSAAEYARLVAAGGSPEVLEELSSPYRSPRELVEDFEREWAALQAATARVWRAAVAVEQAVGSGRAEFVGDDLALVMNTHPLTGRGLLATASGACAVPELMALVESAELSDKHALALLTEAGRWADTPQQQAELIRITVERCQARVAQGLGWPKPGELKKRLQTVAFLQGLTAAEGRKKTVAERRGVAIFPTGVEAAALSIEGPQVMVAQMMDAIRARGRGLHALPGNTRTVEQCEFDAAHDLLCVDAEGRESSVPALGEDGLPGTIRVRGVEISLVMPVSVARGGDVELAEIPGLGPVLPSTARELLNQADRVRRIAVDADTGKVLAVDDARPVPHETLPPEPEPAETTAVEAETAPPVPEPVQVLLERLVAEPVITRDLGSASYRVPTRLRRFVEHRDRTCVFPGCTVPGRYCDVDHREPWPHGPTSPENCHCLCRRHHRAKQAYFTVTVDPDTGDTIWTTPDSRQYRRPPPTF